MKIVHYSLGFPPFRTGGMTKFVLDLMIQQKKSNHSVILVWPGEYSLLSRSTSIIECKEQIDIKNYKIVNSNPVSYDEGIADVKKFIFEGDLNEYYNFFDLIKPDILHIHTFFGLQKNMLVAAKMKSIKIVYSSHDLLPLCPKLTMFRDNKICDCVEDQSCCPECNITALSTHKLALLQSNIYRRIKNNYFVKALRKRHRNSFINYKPTTKHIKQSNSIEDYQRLRAYFLSLIDYVDIIHYNSSLTKSLYEQFIGKKNSVNINLSHLDIKDNKRIKTYTNTLRITYLGDQRNGKGYGHLIDVLDKLFNSRKLVLNISFAPQNKKPYMNLVGPYVYNQLEKIFEITDVLVAPSLFYDTYGFVVLEALSYGVPVIVSDKVGAKDVVGRNEGIIYDSKNTNNLYDILESLNKEKLIKMNTSIVNRKKIPTIEDVEKEIMEKCYKKNDRH